jgi:hypothetical protein
LAVFFIHGAHAEYMLKISQSITWYGRFLARPEYRNIKYAQNIIRETSKEDTTWEMKV